VRARHACQAFPSQVDVALDFLVDFPKMALK